MTKYRVIEGGFWRHGTLHIETDTRDWGHSVDAEFTSDAVGTDLYREIAEWLIKRNEAGYYRRTFSARISWPEFFGVFDRSDGIIDVMVNEEGSMWFIAETHKHYDTLRPVEGVMESWLHGDENSDPRPVWFEELFPDGYTITAFTIPAS